MNRYISSLLPGLVLALAVAFQPMAGQTPEIGKSLLDASSSAVSGCPAGDDLNPPAGVLQPVDFVEVENTGILGNRTRVRADGRVSWRGGQIAFPVTIAVKPEDAQAVINAFRSGNIWTLCRDYADPFGGVPWTVTTIEVGGKLRRIAHRNGAEPQPLRDLERRAQRLVAANGTTRMPPTPVTIAFMNLIGDPKRNIDAVRRTIGPDINILDSYGWTLLMYATQEPASLAQMKSMISAGLKVGGRSKTGDTALMLAASSRSFNPDWIRILLEAGADANAQNDDGQTALMYAVNQLAIYPSNSLGDVVALLRSHGARTEIRDKQGLTVFDYWAEILKNSNNARSYYGWIDDSLRR